MGKVAIVTDSNSGITQAEGKKMGIYVLPMPFYINEELFYEDITLTQEEFYEKLAGDADIKTSQPAPGDVCGTRRWRNMMRLYIFRCQPVLAVHVRLQSCFPRTMMEKYRS